MHKGQYTELNGRCSMHDGQTTFVTFVNNYSFLCIIMHIFYYILYFFFYSNYYIEKKRDNNYNRKKINK